MTTVSQADDRPYWISWYQTEDAGPFELHTPWWVSGFRPADGANMVCAAVIAADEAGAREAVLASFDQRPATLEFRFVTAKDPGWSPYCDRFQAADWMRWPA